MTSDKPLDHVRRPDLPWRTSTTTECGRPVKDVAGCIERDDLLARLKTHGKQRTGMLTCMTCWQTAARWGTFDADPVQAIYREVYGASSRGNEAFAGELRALAALAEKYRDEFDGYVAGLEETVSLDARRRAVRRRGA
jgi:hypothetical protein